MIMFPGEVAPQFDLVNGPEDKLFLKLEEVDSDTVSDGYHTFGELYKHRNVLFLALMREYTSKSWISEYHNDGTHYEGWFIAGTEIGRQAMTYHMPMDLWELAEKTGAEVLEKGKEWDGHTSQDVLERIEKTIPMTPFERYQPEPFEPPPAPQAEELYPNMNKMPVSRDIVRCESEIYSIKDKSRILASTTVGAKPSRSTWYLERDQGFYELKITGKVGSPKRVYSLYFFTTSKKETHQLVISVPKKDVGWLKDILPQDARDALEAAGCLPVT